jgi:colanic acid/amylovoran biosynthesis glycosyltransferase
MDAINGNVLFNTIPFLGKDDFDIMHCHFGPAGYRMEQVLRARKISKPLFVSFHGYDVLPGTTSRFNYKKLFRYASGIFVNSQFLQNRLLEIGAKRSGISIIPVGLLPEYFSKGDCPKPDDLITCIGVGRLIEVKGFEYTIRAFARVKEKAPQYKFRYIIIGEGPLEKKLKSLVKELGLHNEVIFKGALPQQEVFRTLSGSDVFILTGVKASDSAAETQGLVYQEAALFGIPVIGSKLGGVPEAIQDNVTGLLATPGDIEEIAEKLVMLFSRPHLRKSMGENGSRNALNNFNQHLLTDKLLDRYKLTLKV